MMILRLDSFRQSSGLQLQSGGAEYEFARVYAVTQQQRGVRIIFYLHEWILYTGVNVCA